jgi:hypothetical protein
MPGQILHRIPATGSGALGAKVRDPNERACRGIGGVAVPGEPFQRSSLNRRWMVPCRKRYGPHRKGYPVEEKGHRRSGTPAAGDGSRSRSGCTPPVGAMRTPISRCVPGAPDTGQEWKSPCSVTCGVPIRLRGGRCARASSRTVVHLSLPSPVANPTEGLDGGGSRVREPRVHDLRHAACYLYCVPVDHPTTEQTNPPPLTVGPSALPHRSQPESPERSPRPRGVL